MKPSRSGWSRRWAVFCFDLINIPLAWFGAYWLRYNLSSIPKETVQDALLAMPLVIVIQVISYWYFGLYRGVWRFASLPDLVRIVKAVFVGSLLSLLTIFLVMRLAYMPRSVIPIYSILLLFCLGGARFAYRWSKDKKSLFRETAKRVLVVGAGRAGDSLARDLFRDHQNGHLPIAFVDDREQKVGRDIHGIRVVATTKEIPLIVDNLDIDIIMIALPSARAVDMRRIVAICEGTKRPVRTLHLLG